MRPSQLTVANITRTFRLIPETIFLVSELGTVALPTDGVFNVNQCFTWSVEGDKSTANRAGAISAPGKQVTVGNHKRFLLQHALQGVQM